MLRLASGASVTVFDGRGTVARAIVCESTPSRIVARIAERSNHERPSPELVVYQGAPKGSKADDVVEHLAELGVSEVNLFESERTVVRWSSDKVNRLRSRWGARAVAAAKQSHNPFVASIGPVLSFDALVDHVAAEGFSVVLWERAAASLRALLPRNGPRIALVVGPEGGFHPAEAERLARAGAALASLGPTILRTERAGPAAVTALLWHFGRIG